MMKKRFSALLALLLASLLLLSACQGSPDAKDDGPSTPDQQDSQTDDKKTDDQTAGGQVVKDANELVIGTYMPVTTLVPWKTTSDGDGYILRQIYHTLVEMDQNSNFVPSMAEEWECSEDGLTWTVKIREDLYWQTGNGLFDEKVNVTAEDVKFSYDYYLDPANGSVRYTELSNTLKEIKVVDDYTVQFVTNDIDVLWEYKMYQNYIIPKKAVDENWDFENKPVGSGAYKFVEHVIDSQVVLERNDEYFKEPALDKIIFKIISDKSVSSIALQNQEIDIALSMLPTEVGNIANKDYLELRPSEIGSYRWIGFNCKNELFTDPELRKALSMAVDMDSAVEAIFKNDAGVTLAKRAYGPISYERPGGNEARFKEACVTYDPKKAEELLDSLGWTKGSDGIRAKDGKKLSFTLQVGNNDSNREKLAVIVSSQLKAVGVDCTAQTVEWGTHTDDIKNGNVQMYILGGYSNLDGPYRLMHTSETSMSPNCGYSNSEVDALMDEAWRTIDVEKRSELQTQAAEIFISEAPHIFCYFEYTQTGVSKAVQDFEQASVYRSLCNEFRNVGVNHK
jgi:peptide/nickel transport system substrate-binding protein